MNEQTRGLSRRSFLTGAAGMGAPGRIGLDRLRRTEERR